MTGIINTITFCIALLVAGTLACLHYYRGYLILLLYEGHEYHMV